jgi:acyl-CoA dehydrogenase
VSDPGVGPVDLFLEAGHRDLRNRVDAFVRESLEPARIDEEAAGSPRRVLDLLAGHGLLAHAVPARFGGVAERLDLRSICVIREALARGSALADAMFVMQALGSHPLLAADAASPCALHLLRVARGEAVAAIAITEPGAGSDLGAIETTARREGEGYVLQGVKSFISNAGLATFYALLARTGRPEEGRDGLTFFLVEAEQPGLRACCRRIRSARCISTAAASASRAGSARRARGSVGRWRP